MAGGAGCDWVLGERQFTGVDRIITAPPAHDTPRLKLLTALDELDDAAALAWVYRSQAADWLATLPCSRGASVIESVARADLLAALLPTLDLACSVS